MYFGQSCWNCRFSASKIESFPTTFGQSNCVEEKLQFTPFWCGPKQGCSDSVRAGIIESHNFFCLTSYPGEISHLNSANWDLSNDISLLVVCRRNIALHTSSHLTPTEAWQKAVSTTFEGCKVLSKVRLENFTQVFGVGQIFEERATHGSGRIVLQTCSDLSKPLWTCPNLFTIQWPCTLVAQCHVLHFRRLLFFSLTSYPAGIAYFSLPNRELSNGVRLRELYWNRNANPSRSPC